MSNTTAASSDVSELKILADKAYFAESQALISSLSASPKRPLNALLSRDSLNKAAAEKSDSESFDSILLSLSDPIASLKSELGDRDNKSLIALIGKVLALQAKSNSQYWSTLWKQGTTSMNQAVALAPMIYHQVTQSYNTQADQTRLEASSAKYQAIAKGVTAGLMIGIGAMSAYSLSNEEPKNPASQFKNQTEDDDDITGAGSKENSALNDDVRAIQDANNSTDEEPKITDKASRSINQGRFLKGLGFLFKALEKAQGGIQLVNALGGAAESAIDSHFKSKIADKQQLVGQFEATSKELEQYSQYYNQSFQRSEDLRGGSQNNIDTAMQILKSIADTLTQTTQSMFRG
jgi:hypothetical protein